MIHTENAITKILLENAKTFSERREILALTEAEQNSINNNMVGQLFRSAMDKSHIDFGSIPDSKGDITKFKGYKPMVESLALLKNIAKIDNTKIAEIDIIEKAISNIVACRDLFEKGFKLDKDVVVMQYNVLVCACIEATQITISSYLDYVKKIDKIDFVIINKNSNPGSLAIKNLEKFNNIVKSGDYSKVLNSIIRNGNNGFTGVETVAIIGSTVLALISAVHIMRELVYVFYSSRSNMSDHIKIQADLLELNKLNVEANAANLPANKKAEIVKKQEKIINRLRTTSDKLKVEVAMAEKDAMKSINKDNAKWTLSDVRSSAVTVDKGGVTLL